VSFKYLLDTNVISDLMRDPEGPIAEKIAVVGESAICTSIVVAAELRYGAAKRNSKALANHVNAVLSALEVMPLTAPVDRLYGQLRANLAELGTPIGPNDLFIAAHALAEELTLVTANVGEFHRVGGLSVVKWRVT
jgi:tRNA(fMet)-specific endonuclease VapC